MTEHVRDLLQSESLNVPHAFTTRLGGVSSGPFTSLNFGNPSELPPGISRDPKSNIEENFRRALASIGCTGRRIIQVHQVHGAEVLVVRRGSRASSIPAIEWGSVKADAIVTDDPACVATVRVADCCPVLLASHDTLVVAAVHAGWRGVVAGVAVRAVETMHSLGAKNISAAVGPCISAAHFEVGSEVVAEFTRAFSAGDRVVRQHPDAVAASSGKALVGLDEALHLQLARAGVERIHVLPHCTYEQSDVFFSHRRDRGITGRMIGLIGPVAH